MRNRNNFLRLPLLLMFSLLLFAISCDKDDDDNNGFVDADGNVFATVIIGDQEWMAENLRTTKYNDGSHIPMGYTDSEWLNLTIGAYAVYPHTDIDGLNSESEVLEAYGALYNWYAVNTGKLCPTGWRVPTNADWTALNNYAGGSDVAGGNLKSIRTTPDTHPRWQSPNTGAIDVYSFSALPGGGRFIIFGQFYNEAKYLGIGFSGGWWSSTGDDDSGAWRIDMDFNYRYLEHYKSTKRSGFSVRCVRDN